MTTVFDVISLLAFILALGGILAYCKIKLQDSENRGTPIFFSGVVGFVSPMIPNDLDDDEEKENFFEIIFLLFFATLIILDAFLSRIFSRNSQEEIGTKEKEEPLLLYCDNERGCGSPLLLSSFIRENEKAFVPIFSYRCRCGEVGVKKCENRQQAQRIRDHLSSKK